MSKSLEKRKPLTHAERGRLGGTRYTPVEVERGLQAVALLGNGRAASRETGIPRKTLDLWRRDTHADRYAQIREQLIPRIHAQMAAETEDLARAYAETEHQLLAQFNRQLADLKPGETASALRNVGTSRAISVDKALLLRAKPTSIVEHRGVEDILRKLARSGIADVVDGTAEEIAA